MYRMRNLFFLILVVCFMSISCSNEIPVVNNNISLSLADLNIGEVTVEDLGSGSVRFSIRLYEEKVQVHLFCKKNGLQDHVVIDLQNSGEVNNGDGTYTYTHTRTGAYQTGDSIVARFYTYTPASGQVFYPGPTDSTWSSALIYGSGSSSSSSSQGSGVIGVVTVEDLGSGSAKFSIRLSEKKVQVHLFCKKNGFQDHVVNNLQTTGEVDNGDGTYTYTHTRTGAYQTGDSIVARFYTYTPASGQVFYPGPTDSTWSSTLIYGSGSSSSSSTSSSAASSSSQGSGSIGVVAIEDLGSGSAKFSIRLSEEKVQVHLFCKKNGLQDHVVIDLQNSGEVNNGDGTYTYTHTRTSAYQTGDSIVARFYTYTPASGQVFYPGPTDSTWSSVLIYGSGSSGIPAPSTSADTWSAGSGWTLTWADEFSSPTINTANWTHETGAWGWGNNEYQNYTTSLDNSFINEWNGNGMLVIRALYNGQGVAVGNYTSARLKTQGKQFWQYGKVAARIQLPYGQGIWPAFWMLGENINTVGWPKCGEIDIMEMVGGGAGKDDTSHGVVHWDNGGWTYQGGYSTLPSGILADDFHVFEIEWDSNQIVWKKDGIAFFSKSITSSDMSEFHANFFILLNLAVGGNWPGYPDATTVFPQYMYIDWVRVYTK